MGGMGRTINGSYAKYVTLPASNVLPLETELDWAELAAIPESYATAWTCLHDNLSLQESDVVLVRGGTSTLGQAAINIAANIKNVTVLATTRKTDHLPLLESLGCDTALIDQPELSQEVRSLYPDGIDAVMDIVGNTTLKDSLQMVRKGGYVCNAGFLGGGDPMSFNPLTDMPSSVNLNFFASFMLGTKDFPLTDIPMQEIVDRVSQGEYQAKPAHIFQFIAIGKAHEMMESNGATGKIVVRCRTGHHRTPPLHLHDELASGKLVKKLPSLAFRPSQSKPYDTAKSRLCCSSRSASRISSGRVRGFCRDALMYRPVRNLNTTQWGIAVRSSIRPRGIIATGLRTTHPMSALIIRHCQIRPELIQMSIAGLQDLDTCPYQPVPDVESLPLDRCRRLARDVVDDA